MAPRAAAAQYRELICLIEQTDEIRYGKGTPEIKKEAWAKVDERLNALGGALKSGDGWKKAFTEWKSHIKNKMRGGVTLNEVEKKCSEVMGLAVSVSGMPDTVELGFPVANVVSQCSQPHAELVEETIFIEGIGEEGEAGLLETETEVMANDDEANEEPIIQQAPRKSKKNRSSKLCKITPAQLEQYIEYKRSGRESKEEFETLCSILNREQHPSIRTTAQWKVIFGNWEKRVKAKARRIHYEQELTGGGMPVLEILTELELKLLSVISKILLYGMQNVMELGFRRPKLKAVYQTKPLKKKRKRNEQIPRAFRISEKNRKALTLSFTNINTSLQELCNALVNLTSIH